MNKLDLKLEGGPIQISVKTNFLVKGFLAFQDTDRSSDAHSSALPLLNQINNN